MNSIKNIIFFFLIILFLLFSFYPTIFELQRKDKLADTRREFILEHNFYWPDYNLYLSKIRQGVEGKITAVEKYTSELHQGSLIQEFYVVLGQLGKILNLDPNSSYLLGRIILAPLLLLIILKLVKYYFPSNNSPGSPSYLKRRLGGVTQYQNDTMWIWQFLAFLIVIVSGSFPNIYQDAQGITHISRFMEWWSNIDALQRITFIPHILFGQVLSFYLLYQLAMKSRLNGIHDDVIDSPPAGGSQTSSGQWNNVTMKRLFFYILLGNLVGLTFPPSLVTLNGVIILMLFISFIRSKIKDQRSKPSSKFKTFSFTLGFDFCTLHFAFLIFTLPSLLYILFITKYTPWSALITFHRTHPMMIPLDQYILGTGPIFFLGFLGAIVSIIKRDKKWQPLIFWVLATFGFAAIFSIIKDQSPLRFTQTGLFIPLGLLGSYFFYEIYKGVSLLSARGPLEKDYEMALAAFIIILSLYILGSLFMMKTSLDWQIDWISQRIAAYNPDVPYPPQSMYPLREWMDGIRWLKNNTKSDDVVLAEITAANHIPAYAGNTVYFGQSNTVDYDRKEKEVDKFFRGKMSETQAQIFLKNGRIKYIFFSIQEREKTGGKNLDTFYPTLKSIYTNPVTTIYTVE